MPYTLDFRGRAYSICELLSCQGSDFDRGLIQFANPMKQNKEGLYWLKYTLQTCLIKTNFHLTIE